MCVMSSCVTPEEEQQALNHVGEYKRCFTSSCVPRLMCWMESKVCHIIMCPQANVLDGEYRRCVTSSCVPMADLDSQTDRILKHPGSVRTLWSSGREPVVH